MPNQCIIKKYNDEKYKLILFKNLRNSNVDYDKEHIPKGTVNDDKLYNNIIRARTKVFEYAYCNDWQFFSTFTIDKTKYNRYDLKKYHDTFAQWLRNYNRKYSLNIKYLTIPEQHKDGAWHEHGFIMGLPKEHLTLFTLDEKLPHYIRDKLKKGEKIYNWQAYHKKFGFCDFEEIKDKKACSLYVTKYITKDLSRNVSELNSKMYYNSLGLKTSETIKKGSYSGQVQADFQNDYLKIKWLDYNNIDEYICQFSEYQ